jgi:thiamine biosynthesis lipoprotein
MSALLMTDDAPSLWNPVNTGEPAITVWERPTLGTMARIAVWPPEVLPLELHAVDRELKLLDRQASRFRADSEISRIHQGGGGTFFLSEGLAEAIAAALAAARWTEGLVDPTIGAALASLGYDRDFASIDPASEPLSRPPAPVSGWSSVRLQGRLLELEQGVLLDLGATAKGLGSDRAASAAYTAGGKAGGVLVSLGGDISVAGLSPEGGWPVHVAENPDCEQEASSSVVRLTSGALATSSVVCRRWRRGTAELHHIVDPRTGLPSAGPWRTATVAAPSCLTANAASTALIVGGEQAERWLSQFGLPARLVGHDGSVRLLGSWPGADGGSLDIPSVDFLKLRMRQFGSRL